MMTLGSNLSQGPGKGIEVKPIATMFVVRSVSLWPPVALGWRGRVRVTAFLFASSEFAVGRDVQAFCGPPPFTPVPPSPILYPCVTGSSFVILRARFGTVSPTRSSLAFLPGHSVIRSAPRNATVPNPLIESVCVVPHFQ